MSHVFNETWLYRYPLPRKVLSNNGYEFKGDFTPLIKNFNINPVLTTIKKPQASSLVERVHEVIFSILVPKDIDKRSFDYIDPWGETLAYIAWIIREPYHLTIQSTPG